MLPDPSGAVGTGRNADGGTNTDVGTIVTGGARVAIKLTSAASNDKGGPCRVFFGYREGEALEMVRQPVRPKNKLHRREVSDIAPHGRDGALAME
jgi:hypothetical protein